MWHYLKHDRIYMHRKILSKDIRIEFWLSFIMSFDEDIRLQDICRKLKRNTRLCFNGARLWRASRDRNQTILSFISPQDIQRLAWSEWSLKMNGKYIGNISKKSFLKEDLSYKLISSTDLDANMDGWKIVCQIFRESFNLRIRFFSVYILYTVRQPVLTLGEILLTWNLLDQ